MQALADTIGRLGITCDLCDPAQVHCQQEAARIITAQKSGSIINMSSLMGIQGYPVRWACGSVR